MPGPSSKRQHRFAWLLTIASVFLLAFGTTLSQQLGIYGSVCLVCLVCGLVFSTIRVSGCRPEITNVLVLFVCSYFLSFGLYGFMNAIGLSHYLGVTYEPSRDDPVSLSSLASVYAAALLLAIYAGYCWKPHPAAVSKKEPVSTTGSFVDSRKFAQLRLSALLALGLSYTGSFLMVIFVGGVSQVGRDPTYVATEGTHGLYWAVALISTNHWAFIVNALGYLLSKKSKHLFLVGLSFPLFLLEFLLSGSKSALVFPLVGLLIARHYCHRRVNWKIVGALTATVLVVFAAGYTYRSEGAQKAAFGQGMNSYYQNPFTVVETFVGRFYGTDSFAIVLDSIRDGHPLLLGRSFIDLLTWYVPRWLWPGKPLSFALTFGQEFMSNVAGAGDTYFAASLPGELYLDFALPGLLFGGIAAGHFLRYIHRRLIEPANPKIESIVLYAVIAPLAAQLCEGPIASCIEFVSTRVILYAFLFWSAGVIANPALRRGSSQLAKRAACYEQ